MDKNTILYCLLVSCVIVIILLVYDIAVATTVSNITNRELCSKLYISKKYYDICTTRRFDYNFQLIQPIESEE